MFVTESFSTLKKEKQPPYNLNSGENRPYRKNSNGLTTPMNTANTSFFRFSCNYLAKNYRFTTQTISFHTKACSISFMISRINRGEIVREQNYYTPTPISELVPTDFPDNLPEEHRLPEMALKFTAHTCAPDWEDYVGMTGDDNTAYTDWDIIERKLGKWGYPHMESAGRILGYASLIQNGIAEACESRAQEEKQQTYSKKSAREWILLLQLNCIEEEEVDIPFGDCGSLYFYIRQRDLERRDFSQIQFELQCY